MSDIKIAWNDSAVLLLNEDPAVLHIMDRAAAKVVNAMKREAPVSPVTSGHSGQLRSSVGAFRQPDGSILVGATASYAGYVVSGTPPHEIRSHGPWPLRNRRTGQVFGRVVHHPGTRANNFVERAVRDVAAAGDL